MQTLNFSGVTTPIFSYLNSITRYIFFTQRFFSKFALEDELTLKSFFALKLSKSKTVLDDEFKPFLTAVYLTNFLNVSNSAFVRLLNNYPTINFQYVRSQGVYARFLKTRGSIIIVKLPSGSLINFSKLSSFICFGYKAPSFQIVSTKTNFQKNTAGRIRNFGIRPHVRGVAINPVDHPHGGRTGESRPSVSPWAQLTKGYPTVRKKLFSISTFL